jgi:chitin disaccharide deacetylase
VTGRVLIVNADDFGRSPGVNEGVVRCHEHGIVTSATLMVRWPDAEQAAAYARRSSSLAVGLHVDLGEWEYRDGEWRARYEVVPGEASDGVRAEITAQLVRFEQLLGRPPTHFDSHQHVHRDAPVRDIVRELADRLAVPVRAATPGIEYSGAFYGQDGRGHPAPQAITVDALVAAIEALPPGVTELGCHPATAHDHDTTYGTERLREVETLCDPRVRAAIERSRVILGSYADALGG